MIELRTLGVTDLRGAGGLELRAVLQQPKRLALLAYLAIGATGRFVRRDSLLALFWPELDEHHARAALRRALYFLRQAAGDAVLQGRGDEEVGVPTDEIWCDAVAFRDALKAGDPATALDLYQGDFLEGFYIAGAPEAEDWVDRERGRFREQALDAARGLALRPGTPAEAARWARRALELDPINPEMQTLLDRLKRATPAPAAATGTVPADSGASAAGARDPRLVAICPFAVRGDPGFAFLSEGMLDLLATKLDGAGDLRVVEPRLALSGAGQAPSEWDIERGKWLAGRAGAGGFVLGNVVEVSGRLEATAALHDAAGSLLVRVFGRAAGEAGLFELVDELARGLLAGQLASTGHHLASLAARTTESLAALKAWLNGEHLFRLARHLEAADAFRRATEADPSFALAWYRLAGALAASALIEPAREASRQAHRQRERLSEHHRALLEAQHAWITGVGAEAERRYAALVTAWPESLEGWFLLGDVQVHSNPYRGRSATRAREAFERALALDPGHLGAVIQLARLAAMEKRTEDLDRLVDRALAVSATGDQAIGLRALRAWALDRTAEQAEITKALAEARGLTIARTFSDVALYGGDLAGAERLGRDLFAAARSEEFRAFGHVTLAHLALARGRVVEAFDRLREAERQDAAWAIETRGLFAALPFVPLPRERRKEIREELERWDPASARQAVAIPLAFHNELHAQFRAFLLGLLAVRLGNLDAARFDAEALAELPVPPGAEALLQHLARTLDAELLQAHGMPAEALAVLEQGRLDVWFQYAVASPFFAGTYERFLRADLLALAGRFSEAFGWWGAIAERTPFELPFLAPSLRRESEVWRQLGDSERARTCEEGARTLWGNGPEW